MSDATFAISKVAPVPVWWNRLWLPSMLAPLAIGPIWVAGASYLMPENPLGSLAGFVLFALLAVGSYCDLMWRRIPNWATYSATAWALAINALGAAVACAGEAGGWLEVLGAIGLSQAILGLLLSFGLLLAIYACGGSGAGDVKLAAALGALLGPQLALVALVWCYLAAGAAVLGYLVYRYGVWTVVSVLWRRLVSLLAPSLVEEPSAREREILATPVPMAVFFTIGTFVATAHIGTL